MAASTTRSKAPLIAAAVIGVLAIAGIRACSALGDDGDDPNDGTPPVVHREGCIPLTIGASPEKQGIMQAIANDYNSGEREVDGKCFDVTVNALSSGGGEQILARGWDEDVDGTPPDVWSPAASTWVGLLEKDLAKRDRPNLVPDGEIESVTTTPLVLAMPKPMAQALGWPNKAIGWGDVLALANNPQGWAAKGHPEWGKFTLGKTNPNISTSGLAATVGAFVAATGKSSDLTMRDVQDPKVRAFVKAVESAVVHYGDTTLTYLSNLQRADDSGAGLGYVSAVAVEEKSVIDYNTGNPSGNLATVGDHPAPNVPLAAIYPKEGTLYSDSPYVILDAPWSTEEKKAGAADFLEFLQTPESQERFTEVGFRTFDHEAGTPILESDELLPDGVQIELSAPAPDVLDAVRAVWTELRKEARVLILLDVSGSMGQPAGGGTKLELAKEAAVRALSQFAARDQVGLWAFTTDLNTASGIYAELVPVAPISQNKTRIERSVENLTPLNGTPLYAAIRAGVEEMGRTFDSSKINAVVVLTDGQNEYPPDDNLQSLIRELDGGGESTLRVFSIAYGEGADLETLKKISEASRAAAYDATNPANIDRVFTAVLSNF
ncbi:MAG TPA: substrate-binding and VWA domain-containing protein [Nocardioidaceae bacterium]|nr:substrate-binding and VWA domain-containing protein [Nocardioidaceae bacterium]